MQVPKNTFSQQKQGNLTLKNELNHLKNSSNSFIDVNNMNYNKFVGVNKSSTLTQSTADNKFETPMAETPELSSKNSKKNDYKQMSGRSLNQNF